MLLSISTTINAQYTDEFENNNGEFKYNKRFNNRNELIKKLRSIILETRFHTVGEQEEFMNFVMPVYRCVVSSSQGCIQHRVDDNAIRIETDDNLEKEIDRGKEFAIELLRNLNIDTEGIDETDLINAVRETKLNTRG